MSAIAHRTITNSLNSFFVFFWSILVALFLTPLTLHTIGDDQYGVYALVLSVTGILSFLDLGLSSASVRFISESYAKGELREVNKVITTNIVIFFLLGLLLLFILTFSIDPLINLLRIPDNLHAVAKTGLFLAVVGLVINFMNGVFGAVPQAVQRYGINSIVILSVSVLFTLVTVGVLLWHPDLLLLLIVNACSSLALFIGYLVAIKKILPSFRWEFSWDPSLARKIFTFAGFTLVAMIAGNFLFQIDKFIISGLLGSTLVTFYALPVTIAMKIHATIANINNVLFPLSTELFTTHQTERLQRLYIQSSKFTIVFIAAMVVPLFFLSEPLIGYWLGEVYIQKSADVMKVLVLGYGLYALTAVPFYFFAGFNQPKMNMFFILSIVSSNILLLFILVPRNGLLGASYAFLGAQWPVFLYVYLCERKIGLSRKTFLHLYAKMISAIAACSATLLLLRPLVSSVWGVIGLLIFGGVFFILFAFLVKIFSAEDRSILFSYIRKILPQKSPL